MLFDSWQALGRIFLLGVISYITLIVFLRLSGKRTLSKWNAFDFVVTISLGSALATMFLSKDVSFADGAVAFALLIGLQYAITWLSVRWQWVRGLVKSEPALLLRSGVFVDSAMRKERVTESEVRAAVRSAGFADLGEVFAVVLETDGSFSVLKRPGSGVPSALDDVPTPKPPGSTGP
jgi:uncharacterized membrane protein YcaP (DUF421 family)